MEISFDFLSLIHLAAAILGILSGFIILYFGIKSNPSNLPMAIGQIIASIAIFVNFSLISKLIFHWPFMYRMGHVCILIFISMPYLNVAFHTKNRLWKWYDLLHIIPLLIFLVDYSHVLLMSNAQKLVILRDEVNDLNVLGQFRQSRFIGPDFHEKFRTFLFTAYWFGQVVLLAKWKREQKDLSPQKKVWMNWTIVFMFFQFCMFMPFYLSFLGMDKLASYHTTNTFVVLWLLLSSISLFFFPSLLYGKIYKEVPKQPKLIKKTEVPEEEHKKMEEVMHLIELQMNQRFLFLTQSYSIKDFSKDTQVPVYQISKCLNTFRQMGFLDFINQKRVQYCISNFEQGEWLLYSIESIALKCGFTNRNTFTRAFKKFQGCFPSEYMKSVNK